MKKIFFSFTVFTAMLLMVGCGGSDGGSSSGGYGSAGCSYGSYKCKSGDSYWCGYADGSNDLTWQLLEHCSYSCDDYTGKCSSNSGGGNSGGNSGDGSVSECSSGQYKCVGNYSYYCSGGSWGYYDDCSTMGCNSGTGQCNSGGNSGGGSSSGSDSCSEIYDCYAQCETDSCAQACYDNGSSYGQGQFMDMYNCWVQYCSNSSTNDDFTNCVYNYCYDETDACINLNGGGSGGGGSASECTSGQYTCSGSYSYYCSGGYWDSGSYCSNGCNSSTGMCNSGSGGGGSTTECSSGQYKCSGSYSYYCSYGSWTSDQYCSNGCDSSTGKCKSSSGGGSTTGNKPCISSFSGLSTSSSINLYWTTTTSGNCGKAETFTIVWTDVDCYSNYGESCAVSKELSGSSKSYSLNNATEYLWSDSSSIFFTLYARNSYGEDFDGLNCEYNDSMGWFSCN